MDRQLPQPNEVWKHSKGHRYFIIGICFDINDLEKNKYVVYAENLIAILKELTVFSSFIIKDSEQEKYYKVRFCREGLIMASIFNPPISTLNKSMNRLSLGWARPLDMFLDTLEEAKGGGYRFIKIEF